MQFIWKTKVKSFTKFVLEFTVYKRHQKAEKKKIIIILFLESHRQRCAGPTFHIAKHIYLNHLHV